MSEKVKESEIIEEVEIFIKRLHDLEQVIDPRADELRYVDKETGKDMGTLSEFLDKTITLYQFHKDKPETRLLWAKLVYKIMIKAFTVGVIKSGDGIRQKISECEEENARLKDELKKLSIGYIQLEHRYNELKQLDDREEYK